MKLRQRILSFLGLFPQREEAGVRQRGVATHVVILDGTMSTLEPGQETNAGLAYRLINEVAHDANLTVYYEAGIQWQRWNDFVAVMQGQGINRQIKRAYGALASHYEPGDRIMLIGFSRGAMAVRSLAGLIDKIGLLRDEHATERNVRQAYRHYRYGRDPQMAARFSELYCHDEVRIETLAVWDTVKALGVPFPFFREREAAKHAFHSDGLVPSVRAAYQALARDERRYAFRPQVWVRPDGWTGHLEQVWFRGKHSDIGGQVGNRAASRPLSNIPFVWLMEKLSENGLPLPQGWRDRFPMDANAPMNNNWSGWGKLMLIRRDRKIGRDPSEKLHETIAPKSAVS